jgi:hypothetical protein
MGWGHTAGYVSNRHGAGPRVHVVKGINYRSHKLTRANVKIGSSTGQNFLLGVAVRCRAISCDCVGAQYPEMISAPDAVFTLSLTEGVGMEFFYDFAGASCDSSARVLDKAAASLGSKLQNIELSGLGLSEWVTRYWRDKLDCPIAQLQLSNYLLWQALKELNGDIANATLLECGGGCGLLSLLAKEAGVGTVIYSDIDPVACNDARIVGNSIGLPADCYVCGEINEVLRLSTERGLTYEGICSYDLIEHVYDIEEFLRCLGKFAGPRLTVVMGSGANSKNPMISSKIKAWHRQCEDRGTGERPGYPGRDSTRAYRDIRKDIISDFLGPQPEALMAELAERTRGLRKDDIIAALETFAGHGKLPPKTPHATNTCDPLTGNWQEHLMDPRQLVDVLVGTGFDASWFSGFRSGRYGGWLKKGAIRVANMLTGLGRKQSIYFAPYYVVVGRRRVSQA